MIGGNGEDGLLVLGSLDRLNSAKGEKFGTGNGLNVGAGLWLEKGFALPLLNVGAKFGVLMGALLLKAGAKFGVLMGVVLGCV